MIVVQVETFSHFIKPSPLVLNIAQYLKVGKYSEGHSHEDVASGSQINAEYSGDIASLCLTEGRIVWLRIPPEDESAQ